MAAGARHEHSGLCERDRTNLKKLGRWFLLFALAFVLAAIFLGPTDGGLEQTPPWRFVLAVLPLVPGYFAAHAYLKYYLASQVFGEWEDAGLVLWAIASVAYQINYRRAWRRFDV